MQIYNKINKNYNKMANNKEILKSKILKTSNRNKIKC